MHYPIADIQANFGINRLLDIKLPQKDIDTDGRMDRRRTARRTDGQRQ